MSWNGKRLARLASRCADNSLARPFTGAKARADAAGARNRSDTQAWTMTFAGRPHPAAGRLARDGKTSRRLASSEQWRPFWRPGSAPVPESL